MRTLKWKGDTVLTKNKTQPKEKPEVSTGNSIAHSTPPPSRQSTDHEQVVKSRCTTFIKRIKPSPVKKAAQKKETTRAIRNGRKPDDVGPHPLQSHPRVTSFAVCKPSCEAKTENTVCEPEVEGLQHSSERSPQDSLPGEDFSRVVFLGQECWISREDFGEVNGGFDPVNEDDDMAGEIAIDWPLRGEEEGERGRAHQTGLKCL
ncbi:MAG: hypothetical protein Q9222_001886 [Ikaeria aurantiellina]